MILIVYVSLSVVLRSEISSCCCFEVFSLQFVLPILRRLDRIVPVHIFFAQVFHHKTILLSAKCNGKVRVTALKQIIQKLCEHFNKISKLL
jgi:hypothetical protein